MKKNKGFTLIELIISFCIVSTISILLFQVLISIKELYLEGNLKTTFLNKQGIMTKKIYSDFDNYNITAMTSCGLQCLQFDYVSKTDGTTKTAKLEVDPFNMLITYDKYSIEYTNGSTIGKITVDYDKTGTSPDILQIKIPVYNQLVDGDYGLNIVTPYTNTASISNTITVANANIDIGGMSIDIDKKLISGTTYHDGYWGRIFYHNIQSGSNLFTSKDEFLKNNETNKYSALFMLNLDIFKGKFDGTSKTKYYSFLLYYPTSTFGTGEYNKWLQPNNFLKEDLIDNNSSSTEIAWNGGGTWNSGFDKVKENDACGYASAFAGTNSSCYLVLGAKKAIGGNILLKDDLTEYTSQDVELWLRVDNYTNDYTLSKIVG